MPIATAIDELATNADAAPAHVEKPGRLEARPMSAKLVRSASSITPTVAKTTRSARRVSMG